MVLPCWSVAHLILNAAVHRVVRTVRHAFAPVGRHLAHHVRHGFHAAITNHAIWTDAVCRVAPGALAVALLGVSPPASVPQPLAFAPAATVRQASPEGMGDAGPAARSPLRDTSLANMPPITAGDTLGMDLTPPRIAPPEGAFTAPFADLGTPDRNGVPLSPAPWANEVPPPISAAEVLPVPEPSSLLLLATALCSLGLLAHRSRRRRKASASATCGNPFAAG